MQLSKKDHGEYKATLKDERGQDVSVLEIAGKGNRKPSLLSEKEIHFPNRMRCVMKAHSCISLAVVHIVSLAVTL